MGRLDLVVIRLEGKSIEEIRLDKETIARRILHIYVEVENDSKGTPFEARVVGRADVRNRQREMRQITLGETVGEKIPR